MSLRFFDWLKLTDLYSWGRAKTLGTAHRSGLGKNTFPSALSLCHRNPTLNYLTVERQRQRDRDRKTETQREFDFFFNCKDCSLGSVKTQELVLAVLYFLNNREGREGTLREGRADQHVLTKIVH